MSKWIIGVIAAAFLMGATLSPMSAADKKGKKKRDPAAVFKKMDKDGNNELSLEEFVGKREGEKADKAKKAFAKKDKDIGGFFVDAAKQK